MWHFAQSTVACLPVSGYFDVLCSFTPKSDGFHPSTVWHSAHSPFLGRASNCPLCGSGLWQSAQFANATGLLKSPLTWHCTQLTLACMPSSGYFVVEWSNANPGNIFFQLAVVWQSSQRCLNAPLCGSTWHAVQESNFMSRYRAAPPGWSGLWHFSQATFICNPVSGYRVFEWSNCEACFQSFTL